MYSNNLQVLTLKLPYNSKLVAKVQPTTVQNTVQAVEITLQDGSRLELTFMPGPFAGPTHRDEFVDALKKHMSKSGEEETSTEQDAAGSAQTPSREQTSREATSAKAESKSKRVENDTDSGVKQKEVFRKLVRRYTKLDQWSGEGLEIAKQVHAGNGYLLGPTTEEPPKFSDDSEYRKKTVTELTEFLKRMNQEWSDADSHRELHTKAKHSRNDDDLFEYTDTVTGAQIPSRMYEQRYLEYVKAHEVNPVVHLFSGETNKTRNKTIQSSTPPALSPASSVPSVSDNDAKSAASLLKTALGIDISSSCIIDKDFFSSAGCAPSTCTSEDQSFWAAVDSARSQVWRSWSSAYALVCGDRKGKCEARRDRRKSQSTSGAIAVEADMSHVPTSAVDDGSVQSSVKRSRSASKKTDTTQKSRRKARRQSIVSSVDVSSAMISEDEKKRTPRNHKTPQSTRKTQRLKHPANGYARETSALEMIGDEDSDLCQLCYNERALVHMNPCDHVVCGSCWSRLSPSSGKSGSASRRVCPWDREAVTKR
ncbi:unnamed protein product [Phytophthora lilii]|uniref:Unnamed protein product n=1 Tax=Phytophthora lilii TaxID=2077276 RepID=A0A9W6TQJ5_9STRA|nr:unnamed protein product [Phytophthora lilii]